VKEAYLQTKFVISDKLVNLPDFTYILTACNPMDRKLSDLENRKRNSKLQDMINQGGYLCLPIMGVSEDLKHKEPSFLTNAKKDQSMDWAKRFNQRAIFQVHKDILSLILCSSDEITIEMGSFKKRWIMG